jgi:4-hydroxy-2-oxoheptanedioate aldolase
MTTSLKVNTAKRKMLEGKAAIGTSCVLGSSMLAEILSHAGFDFVMIDMQHGNWSDESVVHAFRAIRTGPAIPMARVGANDYGSIGRLLDRGALGIIVPMVNTVEQAQAAANAMRYPPQGSRSFGGHPSYYDSGYERWYNDEAFLAVQIETLEAAENAEAIMSVEGVDGCWIGPTDLAKSMGVDRTTPEGAKAQREMILRVVEACKKTGKIAGISGDLDISFWLEQGLRFVTTSYDGGLALEGVKQAFKLISQQVEVAGEYK